MKYEPHPVAKAFPPLSDAEYRDLLDSVKANGVMTPIVLTADHLVVDGVHRMKAALEADVFLPVRRLPDGQDPWGVGIELNLARRHLNESQRAMIAARLSAESSVGGDRQSEKHWTNSSNAFTQGKAAEVVNVGTNTVKQAKKVSAEAAPEVVKAVDRGDISVSDAAKVLDADHDIQAEAVDRVRKSSRKTTLAKAVKEVVKERRVAAAEAEPNERWQLHHADLTAMRNLVEPGSVDLIVTDPPYSAADCPDLADLHRLADLALKPGGSMLVLVGGIRLPDDLSELTTPGSDLGYQWTIAVQLPGSASHVHARRVSQTWKPVIWMVKGKYDGPTVRSMVRPDAGEEQGRWHEWGQTEQVAEAIMWQFLGEGKAYEAGVVMDPMVGGGGFAEVALRLGASRFVGSDLDEDAIAITGGRLSGGFG